MTKIIIMDGSRRTRTGNNTKKNCFFTDLSPRPRQSAPPRSPPAIQCTAGVVIVRPVIPPSSSTSHRFVLKIITMYEWYNVYRMIENRVFLQSVFELLKKQKNSWELGLKKNQLSHKIFNSRSIKYKQQMSSALRTPTIRAMLIVRDRWTLLKTSRSPCIPYTTSCACSLIRPQNKITENPYDNISGGGGGAGACASRMF